MSGLGMAILIAGLGILVIALNRRARKQRFDQFRSFHSRRKHRMTPQQIAEAEAEARAQARERAERS